MIRKLIIVALVFVIIGVTGSIVTFKDKWAERETIEKNIDMNNIDHLDVFMSNATVELTATQSEEATIVFTGDTSLFDYEEKIDQRTLYIFGREKGIQLFSVGFPSLGQSLKIELPEKVYEQVQIESENGRIHLEDLQTDLLKATTDNGRIKFENIVASDVQARTYNGRIEMNNIKGKIEAHTSNGKVDVALTSIDHPLDVSSSNGAINIVTATEPTNIVVDAYTDNGSIRIFGKKDWNIITGEGNHLVKLRTSNGSIKMGKGSF